MKYPYNGIDFPSEEEMHMYMWLEEAKKHGIIEWFEHQPESFELSPPEYYMTRNTRLKKKVAYVERALLRGHEYTGDFAITMECELPFDKSGIVEGYALIDTKGKHQDHDGGRSFSINQKWMYQKHGIYVHKVIPREFFQKTFVPQGARYTPKQGKVKKCYSNTRLVHEYVELLKGEA